jgi:2-polyprenyl-3-methyl-5-hydroxy-6-metoxy-1,4-benzoquinol methylase
VVAGDVLEHLINPKHILEELFKKLEPSGILIISVPNIANIFVRVNLLFGRFDYTEKGILDKTHLRFFTQKSFKELISIEGAHVEKLTTSTIPIEIIYPVLQKNYFGRKLLQLLHLVTLAFPKMLGYQHLCVLRKN